MGSNAIPMEMSCALRVAETEILFGKLTIHLRGERKLCIPAHAILDSAEIDLGITR